MLDSNRLNVALSRAQCLALVVSSPTLADGKAASLQQLRELNSFCAIREAAADNGREESNSILSLERPTSTVQVQQ